VTSSAGLVLLGASVPASAQALTWSVVPSPNEGAGSYLQGVSCASAAACTAVGYYLTKANLNDRTFIESWDGTSWSVVPSPNRGTADNSLAGVSCVSAAACTAVGFTASSSGVSRTLVESWNGTSWSVVPSPNRGTAGAVLEGVSCITAAACTAVGSYIPSGVDSRTLIESWNGTSWSVVPSPQPAPANFLYGVSCVSATACTVAGNYGRSPAKTLIDSWNGTSWSLVPSPSPGSEYSKLFGVSCASAAACTALGGYANSGLEKTLIESGAGSG
jgi:hypothetical protein